jgi:hypothetical protein
MRTPTVRDRFWLWGHAEGSHNGQYGLPRDSRMTPVEAAVYLDIPNLIMVVYRNQPEPPFDREAVAMRPLREVVWSIIGDAGSRRNDDESDLDAVLDLATQFPNISGAIMDDFWDSNSKQARSTPAELQAFSSQLKASTNPLDLWVVLYDHQLHLPVHQHLDACDVVTYWTWLAKDLPGLADSFARVEELVPDKRKVLGCYMWDFGAGRPMPVSAMQQQCELGLEWLRAGRIDGMIFLASCICDLQIETVEWTRSWLREVGETPLLS